MHSCKTYCLTFLGVTTNQIFICESSQTFQSRNYFYNKVSHFLSDFRFSKYFLSILSVHCYKSPVRQGRRHPHFSENEAPKIEIRATGPNQFLVEQDQSIGPLDVLPLLFINGHNEFSGMYTYFLEIFVNVSTVDVFENGTYL